MDLEERDETLRTGRESNSKKLISDQIGKGRAIVTKQNTLGKSVAKIIAITQGSVHFFGRYNESPNSVYLVAFVDGHLGRIRNEEKWVDGQVCLVKDLEDILWSIRLKRPNDCVVSNNGVVAINGGLWKKQTLGGKFYIFDKSGKLLLEKEFNNNLGTCAISHDGNYAVVSTAFPENSVHFLDIENVELKWSYKNHSREPVLGLSISDDKIQVWTGRTVAARKYDYSLNFEGKLDEGDALKLKEVRTISEGPIEDSVNMLISFLKSADKNKVLKGLKELRCSTSRFRKYTKELKSHVSSHLLSEDKEISQLSEDIILKFGELDPETIEPAVQTILKRIKKRPNEYREKDLGTLGMLGRIKPHWVKNQIPIIIDDLKNSVFWNARRVAAFALGMIGSVDPELVREAVPILAKYLGDAEWWLSKIKNEARVNPKVAIDLGVASGMKVNPEVWVRDAAITALGDIGEQNPNMVKETIPAIISCLKRPEPYTRKKAVITLGRVAKKDRTHVKSAISVLEEMSKTDSDNKVRSEVKKILSEMGD